MIDDLEEKNKLGIPTEEIPEEVGSVKVADEVISIVAGLAAGEVPGVARMSGGIRGGINDMLGKQNFSKGIKVIAEGKNVTIEVYVYIQYGFSIPDVAIAIQEKVKEAVENMTGYEVIAVDINVEGIRRKQESALEQEETQEEAKDEDELENPSQEVKDTKQFQPMPDRTEEIETSEEDLSKEDVAKLDKFLGED